MITNASPTCPPQCPNGHGDMVLRNPEGQPEHVRWCGTWYDCTKCHSSTLLPSPELEAQLAEQREAARTRGRQHRLF